MNPEEFLGGIDAFDGANIIGKLNGGPASDSYVFERDAQRFVLRIDTPVAAAIGLDRVAEAKILACVHRHGLGPQPEFADADRGVLVTRYIEGRVWGEDDPHDADRIRRLASRLRRLHAIEPMIGRPFDLCARIEHYVRIVDTKTARELADDTISDLHKLENPDAMPCLCHNDLVCTNIIETGGFGGEDGPVLIDWEYAAIGDPTFDLATLAEQHGFSRGEQNRLLRAYFGSIDREQTERLDLFRMIYARLARLWLASVNKLADGASNRRPLPGI